MNKYWGIICLSVLFLSSCVVSKKKYKDEQMRTMSLLKENENLTKELNGEKEKNKQLSQNKNDLQSEVKQLQNDTAAAGKKWRELNLQHKQLENLYKDQLAQNKALNSSSSAEKQKLLMELDNKQKQLFDKEKELDKQKANLDQLTAQLKAKEARVAELENLISQKDAAVNLLKKNIEDALLGFDKSELSIHIKDGKIYVSLSEKLLFKSGSTEVDKKGKEALGKLSKVLEKQNDITIVVEGHTDNIPIKTAAIKDNWDLSVLRATSIVRILTEENNVDIKKVLPAGKSEYSPVADNETKEGRAKNRRTEIVLSPNLDKIFKILENK